MRDDHCSIEWAEQHEEASRSFDVLWKALLQAFAVLNRIRWARPWDRAETRCRRVRP